MPGPSTSITNVVYTLITGTALRRTKHRLVLQMSLHPSLGTMEIEDSRATSGNLLTLASYINLTHGKAANPQVSVTIEY